MGDGGDQLDQAERADDKRAGRDRDARRLAAGKVSRDELARENDFFANLDVENSDIVSVGGVLLAAVT